MLIDFPPYFPQKEMGKVHSLVIYFFPSTFLWIIKLTSFFLFFPFYFLSMNFLRTKHSIKEHVISSLENMVF